MVSILVVALVAFVVFAVAVVPLTTSQSRVWDIVLYFVIYASGVVSITAAAVALISVLL